MTDDPDSTELLVRMLSHDLRNPLTAMQLNAQLIERAAVRDGRDKEQRWAAFIASSAQRMDRMIQQLVEAERIRLGRVALARERLKFAEWIGHWPQSTPSGIASTRLRVTVDDPSVEVAVDASRLRQALVLLLELAAHRASESDPLCMDIRTEGATVRCSIRVPRQCRESLGGPADGSQLTAGHDIDVHHARSIIEAHGGELMVAVSEQDAIGFDVVLPVASG